MDKQIDVTVEKSNWRTLASAGPIFNYIRKYWLLHDRSEPLCAAANGVFELGVRNVRKASGSP